MISRRGGFGSIIEQSLWFPRTQYYYYYYYYVYTTVVVVVVVVVVVISRIPL